MHATSLRRVWLCAMSVACGGPGIADRSIERGEWAGTLHDTEVRALSGDGDDCGDCLQLTLLAVLGDTAGPGYVVHTEFAVRDSSHRYWLGQYRDMVKVFDSAGRYVATVGRPGAGPGEFEMPMPVYTDVDGNVHIVDVGNRRETAISPDLQIVAMNQLPGSPWSLVPLRAPGRFVANMSVSSTTGPGHPLHVIDGSELVHSFGAPRSGPADPFSLRRIIAADHADRIYSSPVGELHLEVWTATGQRIVGFGGVRLRESDPEAEAGILNTPASTIQAMHVDQLDHLWVLIAEPRADWRAQMKIITLPNGQRSFAPLDAGAAGSLQSTRILVIDLAASTVVVNARRPEAFVGFLGEHGLLELRQSADNTPQVAVWSLGRRARVR